jgi:hypothetical protein
MRKTASTVSLKAVCCCGLIETLEATSAVTLRQRKPIISNKFLEFLGKDEAIFETALAHESGP